MKIHSFNLFLIVFICIPFYSYAKQQPTFELWNKHTQPIYFSYGSSLEHAMKKQIQELRSGHYKAENFSTASPTTLIISVGSRPKKGDNIDVYTFKPDKTIYVRVGLPKEDKFKETLKAIVDKKSFENEGYIFGPQTGPLLGIKGITEHNYSLDNNVEYDDIFQSSARYGQH